MQTTEEARKYLNKKKETYKATEEEYSKKPHPDERDELLRLLFELRSNFVKQFEKKIEECENSTVNKSNQNILCTPH